eukprot:m.153853 g.153853  ORF g.153853 m.153853 type:complete len:328 (-) comp30856_c1_seq2:178-1161(-)
MRNVFTVPLVRATTVALLFLGLNCFHTVEGSSNEAVRGFGGCVDGITCQNISANNLVFQCRFASPPLGVSSRGNVMMLHGFPEWSDMFIPLMKVLAAQGFTSVACNQRAYSIGARPSDEGAYTYEILRTDVFAVAQAVNFTTSGKGFHLVGHDHGAALGWFAAAAQSPGSTQLLSYSALSIPHLDAFNAGLNKGVNGDIQQQIASQYFTMFVLANSSTLHGDFWYNLMGKDSGDADSGSFDTPEAFQKALWWYNGAKDPGVFSMPPLMSVAMLLEHGQLRRLVSVRCLVVSPMMVTLRQWFLVTLPSRRSLCVATTTPPSSAPALTR